MVEMINLEVKNYLGKLYQNIFGEYADNSKEFLTFVQQNNPHPLRIKIENKIQELNEQIVAESHFANVGGIVQPLVYKLGLLIEFDAFVTNYIENV